ncbi:uncharacterized protein LOC131235023 [Magnolia sinica]|uniref:uncharacterized protein LOC131235023 n=1 Tax=Magnolia sinica TaxID=86752 RepID=UPI00265A26AA|nr:uncharacterized protein LOC131235023 [Magnolia sinica]XP_058088084.1 uncharacterized protein LOC131235023 [Magnolia sinica]
MRSRRSEGGSASVRIRSPPSSSAAKIREHHRSEWRSNPYRKERHSPPPERERLSRRVLDGGDRRSASVERRDFARHLDGGRDVSSGVRLRQFDEAYLRQDSTPIDFRRKYFDFDVEGNPNLKHVGVSGGDGIGGSSTSRPGKDKDFQGNGSSGLDGHGMLLQKSMCLEDGSVRTFFSLPPDGAYALSSGLNPGKHGGSSAFASSSGVNLNVGLREEKDLRYPNKLLVREPYEEEEEKQRLFYSRDASYPTILPSVSQSKAFGNTSSGLGRDDFLSSYREHLHLPSAVGFGRSSGGKFTDISEGYGGRQELFDPTNGPEMRSKDLKSYQRDLISPSRDESRDYRYPELGRRDRDDLPFLSDELYKKMQLNARGDYYSRDALGSTFMDHTGDGIDDAETSRRILRDNGSWDHYSLQRDPVSDYHDVNRVPLSTDRRGELFGSGSTHLEFGTEASRDRDVTYFGGDYVFGRDADVADYRERLRSPLRSEHDPDVFRTDVNPQGPQRRLNAEELGVYDPSERTMKRKHAIDEMDRHNLRSVLPHNHNISRRIPERSGSAERRILEGRIGPSPSQRLGFGRTQYRKPGRIIDGSCRISISDDSLPSEDLPVHVRGGFIGSRLSGSRELSLKRRLRLGPSAIHNSVPFDKRQGFFRPYKFRKGALEERHGGANAHDCDMLEDTVPLVKKKADPPEGSEEFKQLVHRAFLRFSKQLNESPAQQKRYREQGKAGNLLCSVCGSLSKEFGDTHSLVTHAFNSLKVGLRTDHLGLHKAICVMMGWNSLIAPDTGKAYQSMPIAEASALKVDLILWPPLVIIHNSSIGKKNNDTPVVVTNERMEEILREMGFGAGKAKVCRGKPANHSILVVKFMPTFSGLQEAERLNKHYAENKRGRKEFEQIASKERGKGMGGGEALVEKAELLLYGYMGIAEDLDKLDFETKKRCVVKSMKDIEAIADAPLVADSEV